MADRPTDRPDEHHTETIELPLEGWRQVIRRVRMLEALDTQHRVILSSLVETIDAMPNESGQ